MNFNENKKTDVARVATVAPKNDATNATSKIIERTTKIRTVNECIKEAKRLPPMFPLFGNLWQTGQIAFLVGDTGVGKSILAINIANAVTKALAINEKFPVEAELKKILYYDFELSDKQFEKRFSNEIFSEDFYRIIVNPKCIDCNFTFECIKADLLETGANIIIIDNISALSLKPTADADAAIGIMRSLKQLQNEGNISILILAHVPKISSCEPLHINHLAGSKSLSNFADSVFFIAKSKEDKDYRYIKQVKSRDSEELEGVAVFKIIKNESLLSFEYVKMSKEEEHLIGSYSGKLVSDKDKYLETVLKLREEGHTLEQIANVINKNKSTISRWL